MHHVLGLQIGMSHATADGAEMEETRRAIYANPAWWIVRMHLYAAWASQRGIAESERVLKIGGKAGLEG